jgi:DNA-binding NarL/FixJ family response regulator
MTLQITTYALHEIVDAGLRAAANRMNQWEFHDRASDAESLLAIVKQRQPAVVILDPLQGRAALKLIKDIRALSSETEILAYSGGRDEPSVASALAAGARAYVLVTDPISVLLMALEALAAHEHFLTPSLSGLLCAVLIDRHGESKRPNDAAAALTRRERQILALIAQGNPNKRIADLLDVSVRTVETHRMAVMRKLGARSGPDLIRIAIGNKLIEP